MWALSQAPRVAEPYSECDGLRNEGPEHSQSGVQGIIPWPPEAKLNSHKLATSSIITHLLGVNP